MEAFYTSLFTILAIVAFGLEFTKPTSNQGSNVTANQGFYRFRNNYLVVWSLMMGMFITVSIVVIRCVHWHTMITEILTIFPTPTSAHSKSRTLLRSWRLVPGPLRLRPLPALWLPAGRYRPSIHRRVRGLAGVRHGRGLPRGQARPAARVPRLLRRLHPLVHHQALARL